MEKIGPYQRRLTFTLEEVGGGKLHFDQVVDVEWNDDRATLTTTDGQYKGEGRSVGAAALDLIRDRYYL